MLVFDQVSKHYSNNRIGLAKISFKVARGELVFITGHSGAGKSTLLKLILAMEKPSSGRLLLAGNDVAVIKDFQIPYLRRQIGAVFQNHQLLLDKSVFANVALPLQILGKSKAQIAQMVERTLAKLKLADKAHFLPQELSIGQQQIIGIARAIVHKPPLLLADEPTGNLDPKLASQIMNLLVEINKSGTTVLIVSHDLALISRLKLRTLTLLNGTNLIKFGIIFICIK